GKSYTIKRIAADTLAMGGQVIILDRTRPREYARFAAAAPGTSQVVEITPEAPVCLDPLRVFDAEFARVYAIGFLSLLTGHSPTSDEGALLAEGVDVVLATPRPSLRGVIEFLAASDDVMARQVARRLQVFARDRLASLTFHDGAPLHVEADCVVFAVAGLSLPSEQQLRDRHLAGGMLPEQAFSQALLYLIAAVARTAAFADTTRFAAMLTDEAKALRYSPQGLDLLTEMVTDGRKNNAALWVASQQASDMDGTMAELLGTRFAFRQDSHAAAEKAARFVGLRPTDDLLEDMTQLASGQALMRDVRGRVAPVQVIEALDDELHVAFDTHPGGDERSRRIIERRADTAAAPVPVAGVAGDWDGYGEVAG
ncbi:MAG TPA: ATP-binding protein, partial [Euzebyales bacterium]|nr:ATP-binding protein [Euzebyales bacterium]